MIGVGNRYRDLRRGLFGRRAETWIVVELFTGSDGVEYARLAAETEASRQKTLAASVLDDPKHFEGVDA